MTAVRAMEVRKRGERILLVDDAPEALEVLGRNLASAGYSVAVASSVGQAEARLREDPVDLVITDLRLPGPNGLDLVRWVRQHCGDTEVIMITGYATVEGAVEAVKSGAEEYLAKPFTAEELLAAVERALGKLETSRRRQRGELPGRLGLVGQSEGMRRAFDALERAREGGTHLLIAGEPGTGRRAAARAAHGGDGLWLAVDGALLAGAPGREPPTLLLGGELALPGTLYVWGIESAPRQAQDRLLAALVRPASIDASRILLGVPANVEQLVEHGLLPARLLRLLGAHRVVLPPLRERGDDVLLLVEHFLGRLAARLRRTPPTLAPAAVRALRDYPWPGNLAELEAVLLGLLLRPAGELVEVVDLPVHVRQLAADTLDLDRPLAEMETEYVRRVLDRAEGNKKRAAEILRIDRKTLREKLRTDSD